MTTLTRRLAVVILAALAVTLTIVAGDLFSILVVAPFLVGPFVVAGAILALKRPANAIGWLLIACGWSLSFATIVLQADPAALLAGTAPIGQELLGWVAGWSWNASVTCLLAIALVFPSGHLPVGRGRSLAAAMICLSLVLTFLTAFGPTIAMTPYVGPVVDAPNPLAILPDAAFWDVLPPADSQFIVQVLLLGAGAVWIVLRYRRAVGLERLQLTWLVAAIVLIAITAPIGLALSSGGTVASGDPRVTGALIFWLPTLIAYGIVPISIVIAVLRYRLYEIDRIVSRSLAWAVVTGALVATFVALVVGLQTVLAPLTNGSTLAVAASTLIVAALFQPLRRRVQGAVDRRFDRARYDAARVVESFSKRLQDELDLTTMAIEIVDVASQTVRPTSASVWLRRPTETR